MCIFHNAIKFFFLFDKTWFTLPPIDVRDNAHRTIGKVGIKPVTNEARTAKIMLLDRSGLRLLDPGTDMNLVGR